MGTITKIGTKAVMMVLMLTPFPRTLKTATSAIPTQPIQLSKQMTLTSCIDLHRQQTRISFHLLISVHMQHLRVNSIEYMDTCRSMAKPQLKTQLIGAMQIKEITAMLNSKEFVDTTSILLV